MSYLFISSYFIYQQDIDMNFADALRQTCPKTTIVLQVIGALIILRQIYTFLSRVYKLLRKRKNLKKRYGENSWAFITGSSDGIGKALAFALAKQGFNLIISARTQSKLQQVRKSVIQKYPNTNIKILVADYKKAVDWAYMKDLMDSISQLDVSIVINNVGVDILDKYIDLEPKAIQDLLAINCYPVAFINRYFLPIFEKRTKQTKNKCAMVNISSVAGTIPMPYFQIYCASKAYVDRLSQCLNYQHPNIDIISIRPSQVSTPMTFNKPTDIFTITADQCAEGILDHFGYERATYGNWKHQLQGWLYQFVPERLFNYLMMKIFLPDQMRRRKKTQ